MLTSFFKAKRKVRIDVHVDLKDLDPELDQMLREETAEKQHGPWSVQEDVLLLEAMSRKGGSGWKWVASQVPTRAGKQVRERWTNHLDPTLCTGPLLPAERDLLVHFVHFHGRKWSDAARALTQWRKDAGLAGRRSDNLLKNVFTAMKPEEKIKQLGQPLKLIVKQKRAKQPRPAKQPAKQPSFKFVLGETVNFASVNVRMRECEAAERVSVQSDSLFAHEEL